MGQIISKSNINIIDKYSELNFLYNRSFNFIVKQINLIDYISNIGKTLMFDDFINLFWSNNKKFVENLFNILSYEYNKIHIIKFKQYIIMVILFSNLEWIKKLNLISLTYDYNKSGYLNEGEFYLLIFDFIELIQKLISKDFIKEINKEKILNLYEGKLFKNNKFITIEEIYNFVIDNDDIVKFLINLNLFCIEELFINQNNIMFKFNNFILQEIKLQNNKIEENPCKNNIKLKKKIHYQLNPFEININKILNYDNRNRNMYYILNNSWIYSIGKIIVIFDLINKSQKIFTLHKEKIVDFCIIKNNIYSVDKSNILFIFDYSTLEYKLMFKIKFNNFIRKIKVCAEEKFLCIVTYNYLYLLDIEKISPKKSDLYNYIVASYEINNYPVFQIEFNNKSKNVYLLNIKGLTIFKYKKNKKKNLIKNSNFDWVSIVKLLKNEDKYYIIGTLNGNLSYCKQKKVISSINVSNSCINCIVIINDNKFICGDQSGNLFLLNKELEILKKCNIKNNDDIFVNNFIISIILENNILYILTKNTLLKTNLDFENFNIIFQIPGFNNLKYIKSNSLLKEFIFCFNENGMLIKYNSINFMIDSCIHIKENIIQMEIANKGNNLYLGCKNGKIIIVDTQSLKIIDSFKFELEIIFISINDSGEYLIVQDIKYKFYLLNTLPHMVIKHSKNLDEKINKIEFSKDNLIIKFNFENKLNYYDILNFRDIDKNNYQLKNENWDINFIENKLIRKIYNKNEVQSIFKNDNLGYFLVGKNNGDLEIGIFPFDKYYNIKGFRSHISKITSIFNFGDDIISFGEDKLIAQYNIIKEGIRNFYKGEMGKVKNRIVEQKTSLLYNKEYNKSTEILRFIQKNNQDTSSKNSFNYDIKLKKINNFNQNYIFFDNNQNSLILFYSCYLIFYNLKNKNFNYYIIGSNKISCIDYNNKYNIIIGEECKNKIDIACIYVFNIKKNYIKSIFKDTDLNEINKIKLIENRKEVIFIGKKVNLNSLFLKILNYTTNCILYSLNLETDIYNDIAYFNNNIVLAHQNLSRIQINDTKLVYNKIKIEKEINIVSNCIFAFKNNYLIIGSKNGYLCHYKNFELSSSVYAHFGEIVQIKAFNDNNILTAGTDGKILSWYISNSLNKDETKYESSIIKINKGRTINPKNHIKNIIFSKKKFYTNEYKEIRKIKNKNKSKEILKIKNFNINCCCFINNNLFVFDNNNKLKIFKLEGLNFILNKKIITENLVTFCVPWKDTYIISIDDLGFIGYYDLNGNYNKIIKSQQANNNVSALLMSVSPDNKFLVLSVNKNGGQVEIYEIIDNIEIIKYKSTTKFNFNGIILSIDFSENNNFVVNTNQCEIGFFNISTSKIINMLNFNDNIINNSTLYHFNTIGIFQSEYYLKNNIKSIKIFKDLNIAFLISDNGNCAMFAYPTKIPNGLHKELVIFENEIINIIQYENSLVFISKNFSYAFFELIKLNNNTNNMIELKELIDENLKLDNLDNSYNEIWSEDENIENNNLYNFEIVKNLNSKKYLIYEPNIFLKFVNIYGKSIYNKYSICLLQDNIIAYISSNFVIINNLKKKTFNYFKSHKYDAMLIKCYKNYIISTDISGLIIVWDWKKLLILNEFNIDNIIDFSFNKKDLLVVLHKHEYYTITLFNIKDNLKCDSIPINICNGPNRVYFSKDNRLLIISNINQFYFIIKENKFLNYNYINFEEFKEAKLEDGKEFFWIDIQNQLWVKKENNNLIKQFTFNLEVKEIIKTENNYIFLLINDNLLYFDKSFNFEGDFKNLNFSKNYENVVTIKKKKNIIIILYKNNFIIKLKEEFFEELKNKSNYKYDSYNLTYTGNNNDITFKLSYKYDEKIGLIISELNGGYYFYDLLDNKIYLENKLDLKDSYITYMLNTKKGIICSDNFGRIIMINKILSVTEIIALKEIENLEILFFCFSTDNNLLAIIVNNCVYIYEFYNFLIKKKIILDEKISVVYFSLCNKYIQINNKTVGINVINDINNIELKIGNNKEYLNNNKYKNVKWELNINNNIFSNCKGIMSFIIYKKNLDNNNFREILIYGDNKGYINICYYPLYFENQKIKKIFWGNYKISKIELLKKEEDKDHFIIAHGSKNSIVQLFKIK